MDKLNLESGIFNAETMGLVWINSSPDDLIVLGGWGGDLEMVTIIRQVLNICIVGGLHDIIDVKVQTHHLEYCWSLVEQILVFFHFMEDFMKTNELIHMTYFVNFMHFIIDICQYYPYMCLFLQGPQFCFVFLATQVLIPFYGDAVSVGF